MARGDVVTFRNNPGQLALASSNPQRLPGRRRKKYSLPSPLIGRSRGLDSDTSRKKVKGVKKKKKSASQTVSPLELSEERSSTASVRAAGALGGVLTVGGGPSSSSWPFRSSECLMGDYQILCCSLSRGPTRRLGTGPLRNLVG